MERSREGCEREEIREEGRETGRGRREAGKGGGREKRGGKERKKTKSKTLSNGRGRLPMRLFHLHFSVPLCLPDSKPVFTE